MKLSVIVATRNRAHAIVGCLDSIAAALANAAPLDAEIVVVDNGSQDATSSMVGQWATDSAFPVRLLFEPKPGSARARNRSLLAAQGDILAFTDDDCHLSKDYVNDLLRHDATDTKPVLRGGRVELGDPTDLPITIQTNPTPLRFNRRMDPAMNPIRRDNICAQILGCNMTMRQAVVERLGPFDERFGPGTVLPGGDDCDYLIRAYLAGLTIEYVPDMTVFHHHGRKQQSAGYKLIQGYSISNGALCAKYFFKHPKLCLPIYWDIKKSIKEIIFGTNLLYPVIGFSFKHRAAYGVVGAVRYFLNRTDFQNSG